MTALHHMDMDPALTRMAELLRPGGALGVVGVARRRWPHDLPLDVVASVATRVHHWTKPQQVMLLP